MFEKSPPGVSESEEKQNNIPHSEMLPIQEAKSIPKSMEVRIQELEAQVRLYEGHIHTLHKLIADNAKLCHNEQKRIQEDFYSALSNAMEGLRVECKSSENRLHQAISEQRSQRIVEHPKAKDKEPITNMPVREALSLPTIIPYAYPPAQPSMNYPYPSLSERNLVTGQLKRLRENGPATEDITPGPFTASNSVYGANSYNANSYPYSGSSIGTYSSGNNYSSSSSSGSNYTMERNSGESSSSNDREDSKTPSTDSEKIRRKAKVYEGFTFMKAPTSVSEIWQEYSIGINNQPAVKELEAEYKTGWRKDPAISKKFNRRKVIYNAIENGLRKGYKLEECIRILENFRTVDALKGIKQPIGWFSAENLPEELLA